MTQNALLGMQYVYLLLILDFTPIYDCIYLSFCTTDSLTNIILSLNCSADISSIPLHVVEEMQREEFVQEISELVHRQLVTSTLQGNFRTTLELTMRVCHISLSLSLSLSLSPSLVLYFRVIYL